MRLVLRRIREFFFGPYPDVHTHYESAMWQLGLMPFIKWQRPVTDSAYHFDKVGLDLFLGPWTLCLHWIDNDKRKKEVDH